MSRPKPTILQEYTNPKTYKSEQVLAAETIYAVYFNGAPINLRTVNAITNEPAPKYKKTMFVNPGHAFNLADKLNKLFKTTKFEVFQLGNGTKVEEQ